MDIIKFPRGERLNKTVQMDMADCVKWRKVKSKSEISLLILFFIADIV